MSLNKFRLTFLLPATQILAANRETIAFANDVSATSSFEGAFGILKNYFIAVSFYNEMFFKITSSTSQVIRHLRI